MTEVWKPIKETNGCYEVSNCGRIRNKSTSVVRKAKLMPNGYLRVHYNYSNKRHDRYVHRLVAEEFCERPDCCDVVNHKDMNKQNNRADNLEWTTALHNVHHSMMNGKAHFFAVAVVGTKDGESKKYISAHQAGLMTGCDSSAIIKCCRGKRKAIHGFTWRYAEVV